MTIVLRNRTGYKIRRYSPRLLRIAQKALKQRGVYKHLPSLPEDWYGRYTHACQTIGFARFMKVLDEIKSRQGFEPQSACEIFADVEDDMIPSHQVSREIEDVASTLMKMPLGGIVDTDFMPHGNSNPSSRAYREFVHRWGATQFDPTTLHSFDECNWVSVVVCEGHRLTHQGLARYREVMDDLEDMNIIPMISNILCFEGCVMAILLLPDCIRAQPVPRVFEPHSGVVTDNDVHGAQLHAPIQDDERRQQQMTFSDQDTGYTYHIDDFVDDVRKSRDERVAAYKDFLKRPIKLNAYKWQVGGTLNADINPWDDYFGNNTRINNRISYFNLLRGKLCVKFIVSGTGFHYGRVLVSYMPLHRFDDLSGFSSLIPQNLVQMSQLPHIFINPTTQQGGLMCLPYFNHQDYSGITNRDWLELGNLQVRSLGTLKHANGGTDDVTVTVFAWMEDVEVSIPTSVDSANLQPQSGEEVNEANKDGVISGPATKISSITGMLSSAPVIGPYASATSKVAAGVAMAAKAVGLSRPPLTKCVEPYKPESVSSLALTTVPDRSAKLTVDDKQELSIDPRISGIGGDDPLDILSIAKKESFYTSFIWPKSANVGDDLFEVRVQPTLWAESAANTIHLTALGYASMPFLYWTGSLKFRFQIQASSYHKGRLRVVYDPNWVDANSASNGDDMITNYTQIVDIANTTDFTMTVTPGQDTTLMGHFYPGENTVAELYHGHDGVTAPTPFAAKERFVTNGVVGITVLNELTTPNSTINNDVRVNCYVSAGDDFQVFVPTDFIKNFSTINLGFDAQSGLEFEPHSGEMKADKIDDNEVDMPMQAYSKSLGLTVSSPRLNEIYTGEHIKSFRTLMKRFCKYYVVPIFRGATVVDTIAISDMRMPAFPPYRGDPHGAIPVVGGAVNYNQVNMTWLHYVVMAFQGHRGSVRYKFVPISRNNQSVQIVAERDSSREAKENWINIVPRAFTNLDSGASTGTDLLYQQNVGLLVHENVTGIAGGAVSNGNVNSALEVEVPYMHNFRFHPGKRGTWTSRDIARYGYDAALKLQFIADTTSTDAGVVELYLAAGEDYTTYFFTGCPPLLYEPNFA